MFNVILFTDTPEMNSRTRGYGVHRLATHIRNEGYSCLVVDFMSGLTLSDYKKICDYAVGNQTLMIGVSLTWLPYRLGSNESGENKLQTHDPGRDIQNGIKDKIINKEYGYFSNKMNLAISNNDVDPWFDYVKKLNPNIKICLGGSKIGMYLDIKMVDHFFVGYSETMLTDYLDSLSGKKEGIIWNRIIDYDPKAQKPVWDFTLSRTQYTEFDLIQSQEPLSLEVGRGCRFKCKFCSYPLIGMKNINSYIKKSDNLRDELIDNYEKHGTTRYFIIDDTFNDSLEKVEYFLNVVKSLPFRIYYWCYLRLDLLAAFPKMIPMLKESGMIQCYFGIETFNVKAGRSVGKGGRPDKLKETLYKCKEIWGGEVSIQAGFIVGLPHEDSESIMNTAMWLARPDCPIDIKWIVPLSIGGPSEVMKYTYTSEFDRNFEKYGYSFPNPAEFWKWQKQDGTDITSSEIAEDISKKAETFLQNKTFTKDLNTASLPHHVLSDIELTGSMTAEDYTRIVQTIDIPELYQRSVKIDYFTELIEKLRIKRNIFSSSVDRDF